MEITKDIIGMLVILAQVAIVVLALSIIMQGKYAWARRVLSFVSARGLLFSFIVALTATLGSLFYSEIAHYEPCKLCWIQRIFMYPLAILFYLAYLRREVSIYFYTTILAVIGGMIALYHYFLQLGIAPNIVPCTTVGYSVDCAKVFTLSYGYISIPLMAFTAFLFICMIRLASYETHGN